MDNSPFGNNFMLVNTFKTELFSLIKNSVDELIILETHKKDNCYIADKNDQYKIYSGFILSDMNKVQTICNVSFYRSSSSGKYLPRLEFKKVNKKNLEEKTTNKEFVRISFSNSDDGCEQFWKMIAFLRRFKDLVDICEFDNYFSLTDKNLGTVLSKIADIENKERVIDNLERLSKNELENINDLVSVVKIKEIIQKWETNKENSYEDFWQNLFKENNFILSQIFACPFIFIQEQFFCGGKKGNNNGGVETDFIYQNKLTNNTAFIEIKTPKSKLVNNSLYLGRDDLDNNAIYSMSSELSGGVNEILNQRNLFIQKKDSLEENEKEHTNFKCIFIGGKLDDLSVGQKKSFDIYRNSLRDVEIITYDELFGRINLILKLLM